MSARTKFLMFIFGLATVQGIAIGVGEGWKFGVASFSIVFGFWLFISFTRSERFAQLRPESQDERQREIGTEAAALTGIVLVLVALVGAAGESLDGRYGPYGVMCTIGGATYLLASLLLPRRR